MASCEIISIAFIDYTLFAAATGNQEMHPFQIQMWIILMYIIKAPLILVVLDILI